MRSAILIFCSIFGVIYGLDLPAFIRRCSFRDPNLSQCIETNANLAIPQLVKGGVNSLDIPVLSPLFIPKLELPGNGFTVVLSNIHLEGLENTRIQDVNFKIGRRLKTAILVIPLFKIVADYKIVTNGLFARSIQGGGKLEISLDQNSARLAIELDQYEKNGDFYIKLTGWNVALKTQRIFYNFFDLYTLDTADFPEFLSKHKEIVDYRIRPAIEKTLLKYIKFVMDNLTERVPTRNIFNP